MRRVADRPQPKAPSWLAWDGTARTGTAGPTRPAEAPASLAPDLPSTTTHPIGTRPTLHESERLRYVCTLGLSVPGAWRASMTRFRREIARLHAATPENKRLAKSVIVTSRTAVDCMVMMSPGPSARQPPNSRSCRSCQPAQPFGNFGGCNNIGLPAADYASANALGSLP